MKRYLTKYIQEDLGNKIILLTGPRQTGKTTLSKMLTTNFDYFNFDSLEDRLSSQKKSWDRSKELKREKTFPNGAQIRKAHNWLSNLSLP